MKILQKIAAPDFTFLVAFLRAVETRLLNLPTAERMISADSADKSFKILNDTFWADFLDEVETVDEFEKVLRAGIFAAKKNIEKFAAENSFDFLWLFFDLQNAKIFLKAFLKNEPRDLRETILSHTGTISAAKMSEIIFDRKKVKNFKWLLETIETAENEFAKKQNPEIIDEILTRDFFVKIFENLQIFGTKLTRDFFKFLVDCENLKAFLRRENFENFLRGGEIKIEIFFENEKNNFENFIKKLPPKFCEILKNSGANFNEINFSKLEKKLDDELFSILKTSQFEPQKLDAAFAFFWQILKNAEAIRAILLGKMNNFPSEKIRKNLPKFKISIS